MELNLRLILLMVASLFVFGVIFESLRRKKQRREALSPDFRNSNPYNRASSASGIMPNEVKEPSLGGFGDDILGPSRVIDPSEAKVPQNKPIVKTFEHLAAKKVALKPKPENTPVPQSKTTFVMSATSNDLIVFYIMAPKDRVFGGYELLQTIESAGLTYGPLGIFHCYEESHGNKELAFCLASAFEPGTFDIEKMGAFSCLGLCIFMSLNHREPLKTFNLMVEKIHQLAEDLNGIVCDSERLPCGQDFLEQCRSKVIDKVNRKNDKLFENSQQS